MTKNNRKKLPIKYCDFCGLPQSKEITNSSCGPLIEGPGATGNERTPNIDCVYICSKCVHFSEEIFRKKRSSTHLPTKIPSPKELVAILDQYIIGQATAKKFLAVAVVNHYKRLINDDQVKKDEEETILEKSNVLLLGKTGCGKTLLCRTLAKVLDVPFAIGDATSLTEAGYVGEDVENLLLKLIQAADYDIAAAQSGIIYIDEIDKISKTQNNTSITRDVSGEGVQQALLKILEGTVANVPPGGGRKHPEQQYVQIDTTNILFICGGAFVGLEDIVSKRIGKRAIGFINDNKAEDVKNALIHTNDEDLVEYGMIPEFIGRMPVIAALEDLSEDDLVKVLVEPKNSLVKQYKKLFYYNNANLEFTHEAIHEIAKKAVLFNTGARALRNVMEKLMLELQYNMPTNNNGMTYLITDRTVRGEESPLPFDKKAA